MKDERKAEEQKEEQPWPTIPMPLQHLMSMKWATMESVRIIQSRLKVRGQGAQVLILTAMGLIKGDLSDITDSYEAAIASEKTPNVDIASAAVHLRTELWNMYSQKDECLEMSDSGAVVHITNATIRVGSRRLTVNHLALFVSEIIGFALCEADVI